MDMWHLATQAPPKDEEDDADDEDEAGKGKGKGKDSDAPRRAGVSRGSFVKAADVHQLLPDASYIPGAWCSSP